MALCEGVAVGARGKGNGASRSSDGSEAPLGFRPRPEGGLIAEDVFELEFFDFAEFGEFLADFARSKPAAVSQWLGKKRVKRFFTRPEKIFSPFRRKGLF